MNRQELGKDSRFGHLLVLLELVEVVVAVSVVDIVISVNLNEIFLKWLNPAPGPSGNSL